MDGRYSDRCLIVLLIFSLVSDVPTAIFMQAISGSYKFKGTEAEKPLLLLTSSETVFYPPGQVATKTDWAAIGK